MNLLWMIIGVAVLSGLLRLAWYLVELVKQDGYGLRDGRRNPPRSHPRDLFDPSGPGRLA